MARSLSGAAASLADGFTLLFNRRGYTAAAAMVSRRISAEEKTTVTKMEDSGSGSAASSDSNSWTLDPVTGYYGPANRRREVDAVELQEKLASRKQCPDPVYEDHRPANRRIEVTVVELRDQLSSFFYPENMV